MSDKSNVVVIGVIGLAALLFLNKKQPVPPGAASLSGQITDASTGAPIDGATVKMGDLSTASDSAGNYSFANIAPGSYPLKVTKSGYQEVNL